MNTEPAIRLSGWSRVVVYYLLFMVVLTNWPID